MNDVTEDEKWAKKLSLKCGVEPKFLQRAVEEIKESCGADSKTSREIIAELTTTCHLDKKELMEFVKEVAKNCPMDIMELHKEIQKAEGSKDIAFRAINKVSGDTDIRKRSGAI